MLGLSSHNWPVSMKFVCKLHSGKEDVWKIELDFDDKVLSHYKRKELKE